MNHTLTCSTTSNATETATLTESAKFNSSFKSLTVTSHQPLASDLTKPALLDRLSDHLHPNQMSGTASTQREPDWTTTRCRGMTRQSQSMARRVYHNWFKKPALFSRISLGIPNGRGRRYSAATDQSHNFRCLNGSTCSAEMLSTSTTSSPTSTRCRTARVKLLSSVKTLNYSTGRQPQQKLSKPMETGLSRGIVWSKPHSSCSNTEDPSYLATEGTSNTISQHYPFSTTTESSIMTEQSGLEPLNAETLTCQKPLSSATYKSNGLTTHLTPFSVIQRDLLTKNQRSPRERERKVAGVLRKSMSQCRSYLQLLTYLLQLLKPRTHRKQL